MREIPARLRALLINRAVIPIEKYASVLSPPQDQRAVIFRFHGVLFDELGPGDAQSASQPIDFALGEIRFRHFAAIRAGAAIDPVFDLLRHTAESSLLHIMRLHEAAEALVFGSLFLAQPLDLNQIRDHQISD